MSSMGNIHTVGPNQALIVSGSVLLLHNMNVLLFPGELKSSMGGCINRLAGIGGRDSLHYVLILSSD